MRLHEAFQSKCVLLHAGATLLTDQNGLKFPQLEGFLQMVRINHAKEQMHPKPNSKVHTENSVSIVHLVLVLS